MSFQFGLKVDVVIQCGFKTMNSSRCALSYGIAVASTREAEAVSFISSRPFWAAEQVPGQPGPHGKTLCQTKQEIAVVQESAFVLFGLTNPVTF